MPDIEESIDRNLILQLRDRLNRQDQLLHDLLDHFGVLAIRDPRFLRYRFRPKKNRLHRNLERMRKEATDLNSKT